MKLLTDEKLASVYDYIYTYQIEHGDSPTYRDIQRECNIASLSGVFRVIERLTASGSLDADGLRCRGRKIVVKDNLAPQKGKATKLLGPCPCGVSLQAVDNIEAMVSLPVEIFGKDEHFILRAKGFSMINKGIYDGDFMIVKPTVNASIGDVVIARINEDEITTKTLQKKNGVFYLKAENDAVKPNGEKEYQDIYPEGEWAICGIVVQTIHKITH